MPNPTETPGQKPQKTGHWWLAALILPIAGFGLGILLGYSTPFHQDDWMGAGIALRFFIGLFGGCVACVAATIVSLWKREERAVLSLIAGLPAMIFLCWVAVTFVQSEKARKLQVISNAQSRKQEEENWMRKKYLKAELRAHPELITSDEFWTAHNEPARNAEWGLHWLLQDKTFVVTPVIKEYVLKHFPQEVSLVLAGGRSTHEELQALAADKKTDYHVREEAIDALLRDASFSVTAELKSLVLREFSQKIGLLFGGRKYTRADLEQLLQDPKAPDWIKQQATQSLKSGYFQRDAQ